VILGDRPLRDLARLVDQQATVSVASWPRSRYCCHRHGRVRACSAFPTPGEAASPISVGWPSIPISRSWRSIIRDACCGKTSRRRADVETFESYAGADAAPIAADIVAIRGEQDRAVSFADVAGWHDYTRRGFTLLSVPGDHFFVESAPSLVAQELRSRAKATEDVARSGR
jgi:hypothetical protein